MSYLQLIHSKKTILLKHYLQFLSFKKHLILIRKKNHFIKQKLFKLRTFHFN